MSVYKAHKKSKTKTDIILKILAPFLLKNIFSTNLFLQNV